MVEMSGKRQLVKFSQVFLCLMAFRDPCPSYPDALAVSQGTSLRPTLFSTVSDANLVYEFLLSGLVIDEDDNVGMRDQEMASMVKGRLFLNLINDDVPKTVPAMEELLVLIEEEEPSFEQDHFPTLILGIIYSAYQAREKKEESQQQAWTSVLRRLANATLINLRKS